MVSAQAMLFDVRVGTPQHLFTGPALKMPEPLTTVGLECQPIKVLTVK